MLINNGDKAGGEFTPEEPSSMSRKTIVDYMPTDFFSRQALELTFRLVRNNNALLARAIKEAIDSIPTVAYEDLQSAYTGEMLLNTEVLSSLKAHNIGKIVALLTEIGEEALRDKNLPSSHMAMLRALLEDWVKLTEWVLQNTAADQNDHTFYH